MNFFQQKSSKIGHITLRLTVKLRYALLLLARRHDRTITSVIERAISNMITDPKEGLIDENNKNILEIVWHPDEHIRFIRLASHYQGLLSEDEQRIWWMIVDNALFWKENPGDYDPAKGNYMEQYRTPENINSAFLLEHWELLKKVVMGEVDKSLIPTPQSSTLVE